MKAGRFFADADRSDPTRIVVNESFARTFFPGENAVGKQVSFTKRDNLPLDYTIIGVIADFHEKSLMDRPGPAVVDHAIGFTGLTLLVRSTSSPEALGPAIRAIMRDMDPQIAPGTMKSLESLRDAALARSRFFASALALFAGVGLLLAIVGIYGVLAQLARNRTRDIGIRIALGARPAQVRWLVVRHGSRIVGVGAIAGVVIALATSHLLSALLFGLSPNDPGTLAVVVFLLSTTGIAASFVPAWRASRVDPVEALRAD